MTRILPLFLLSYSLLGASAPIWKYEGSVKEITAATIYEYSFFVTLELLNATVFHLEGASIRVATYQVVIDSPRESKSLILQIFEGPYFARWPLLTVGVSEFRKNSLVERAALGLFSLFPLDSPCWEGAGEEAGIGLSTEQVCFEDRGETVFSLRHLTFSARAIWFSSKSAREEHEGIGFWIADLNVWAYVEGRIYVLGPEFVCFYKIWLIDGENNGMQESLGSGSGN